MGSWVTKRPEAEGLEAERPEAERQRPGCLEAEVPGEAGAPRGRGA